MRYLVISDIHANLEAYETVMETARQLGWDRVVVLGDLVGYGGDPNAVVDRIRELTPYALIRGNHDKVGSGIESADGFNAVARSAIRWTYDTLTPANRQWLAALPAGPVDVDGKFEICHGTPFDEDAYVFDDLDALRALHASRRPLCLFGHTHVPAVFSLGNGELEGAAVGRSGRITLDGDSSYLINCGAVGQPRDGDSRAAYGFYDTDTRTLTMARQAYDIAGAQAKIVAAGLPEVLAQRLALGR